jgi:glycosyltransferase involved in cell wall biosynthesis
MPWHLAGVVGARGVIYEVARSAARSCGRYANPLARLAWRRAQVVLVQNFETRAWLPRRHRDKVAVFPHVVLDQPIRRGPEGNGRTALFAARLLPWKGGSLVIAAVAHTPDWRLRICGEGRDLGRLRRLADEKGVSSRVEFLPWLPREELLRVMREEADLLLFPSLHDEAGWVVVEALTSGLPVLCLDRGGPPLLAGNAGTVVSAAGRPGQVAERLAAALESADFRGTQTEAVAETYQLEARFQQLRTLLADAGLAEDVTPR